MKNYWLKVEIICYTCKEIVPLTMQKFLESVAADLWARYGERVGELKLILPNTRTRVFFVDALSKIANKPIWAPEYLSIDSLMVSLAGLERADSIAAITELYRIYSELYNESRGEGKEESFDSFYRWGEVLLGDFDAVDKYLIDADMLFGNIADLKEVDADVASYMTEEQLRMVNRFWREFEPTRKHSSHKERFLSIWRILLPTYKTFRERLSEQGVGYTGMIYRRAAERLRSGDVELPEGGYVVVGFNALSAAERVLFDHLKNAHEADFYWDYDDYYLKDEKQEAGLFVRENLRRYPSPASFSLVSHFAEPKQIRAISTASSSLQCKYVGEFVEELVAQDGKIDRNTAIVLTDEGLLSPLLYSLPDSIGKVNITMGYPLRSTLAYSFTERLLQLQLRSRQTRAGVVSFYYSDVEGLLGHPFIVALDRKRCSELRKEIFTQGRIYVARERLVGRVELLDRLFTHHSEYPSLKDYLLGVLSEVAKVEIAHETTERRALNKECFGLIDEVVRKTDNSIARCGVKMTLSTYVSLLRRVLQGVRIPYSGEPLSGVQVMGILETRNLDFDNVILLSMNDDNFPSGRITDTSFIPYNLRYAYGMPTPRHNEGVYAYYFYRLIQRAERVDMVYCSVADEKSTGEQSRYIYQLDFESPHNVERIEKSLNVSLAEERYIVVEKRGGVLARLRNYLVDKDGGVGKRLSPSTFNNYMECGLKFYFKAIAGIRTEEEIEEGVDSALFGTIFHKAAELLYKPMQKNGLRPADYLPKLNAESVHQAVVDAISEDYFAGEAVPESEYGGSLLVVRDTVEKYLTTCLLPFDSSVDRGEFKIGYLEQEMSADFEFDEQCSVRFYGFSDRIDCLPDGKLRIVDYKTGSLHKDFAGLTSLLSHLPEGRNGAVLQTLIYSMVAERMQSRGELTGKGAVPSLYYVRYLGKEDYSPLLNDESADRPVTSYDDYREEFEALLAQTLRELFDPQVPFTATEDEKVCQWCDFAKICRR